MIDEKRLESLKKKPDQANYITKAELDDLLRLARLGLWAEKHFETVRFGLELTKRVHPGEGTTMWVAANRALAALPKEKA